MARFAEVQWGFLNPSRDKRSRDVLPYLLQDLSIEDAVIGGEICIAFGVLSVSLDDHIEMAGGLREGWGETDGGVEIIKQCDLLVELVTAIQLNRDAPKHIPSSRVPQQAQLATVQQWAMEHC